MVTSLLFDPKLERLNDFVPVAGLQHVEVRRGEARACGGICDAGQIFVRAFTRAQEWTKVLLPEEPDES